MLFTDFKLSNSSNSMDVKALQKSPSIGLKPPPSLNDLANRLSVKRSTSILATAYSLADLQSATRNFATASLLGEGSVGRVYKAKYADGKVCLVQLYFGLCLVYTLLVYSISLQHRGLKLVNIL